MKRTLEPELMDIQVQAEAYTAHHLSFAAADLDRQPELASRARLLCDKLPSPRLETLTYDLPRAASRVTATALVERYTRCASPVLRQDVHYSLFAALQQHEVEEQLREEDFQLSLSVPVVGDRHRARHPAVWGRRS
ncbi:hypothetical protein CKO42_00825 [Lamprobacter modestohalophilus]|uniref:Uncharacterized protein n=1 Tax=Lamprobacter modestohalophilus TaxID=1064514 RepID=A0A9X0W541_9GAMM|nr:hypothetical protein [Lamprobacter modestohalophilus]MBK1617015.1 hypothetical protein [Lamprobacter modestohalophilus]